MPEKLNWIEHEHSPEGRKKFIAWFIISTLPTSTKGFEEMEPFDSRDLDVSFTVNGVEVEALPTLERLWEQYAKQVDDEATKKFKEFYQDAKNQIEEALSCFREKLGVTQEESEDW